MSVSPDVSLPTVTERLVRAARRRARRARQRLRSQLFPPPALVLDPTAIAEGEVAVYFADGLDRAYQVEQWLPVLEHLARSHPVVVVLRSRRVLGHLQTRTTLPLLCVAGRRDLASLYDVGAFKVCLYVNNGMRNFHSLSHPRMLHVHVNHGESDKLSSFSNQVKAYDRVLVAGPAAVRRYRHGLLEFDHSKVVAVGRPQLDLRFPPELAPTSRRTVLYAPTWEGDVEANNWTSVDLLGPQIVAGLLEVPDVRVVYKPHPLVARSKDPAMVAAHRRITSLVQAAAQRDPGAGHVALDAGNLLAMFESCDALVGDVSSVPLDFLYLRPDAPVLLTDRRADRAALVAGAPLAAAVPVLDAGTVSDVARLVTDALARDGHRAARRAVRADYFGDLGPGDSTRAFTATVSDLVHEVDRLLGVGAPSPRVSGDALAAAEDLGLVS